MNMKINDDEDKEYFKCRFCHSRRLGLKAIRFHEEATHPKEYRKAENISLSPQELEKLFIGGEC